MFVFTIKVGDMGFPKVLLFAFNVSVRFLTATKEACPNVT